MRLRRTLPLKRNQASRSSSEANSQFDEGQGRGTGENGIEGNLDEVSENQESGSNEDDYEPSKCHNHRVTMCAVVSSKIPHGLKYNNKKRLYCICQQEYQSGILMFFCEGTLTSFDIKLNAVGGCDDWYHPSCVGMSQEQVSKLKNSKTPYYCDFCSSKNVSINSIKD